GGRRRFGRGKWAAPGEADGAARAPPVQGQRQVVGAGLVPGPGARGGHADSRETRRREGADNRRSEKRSARRATAVPAPGGADRIVGSVRRLDAVGLDAGAVRTV